MSKHKIEIINATIDDYPIIQNMARFYVYDLSRYCGHDSIDWSMPEDGMYESTDFKNYFEDNDRKAYLIKVNDELAGFVLINKMAISPHTDWNLGEFFIISRWQNKGIGERVANYIWDHHIGIWEISVIPENKKSIRFWEKAISNYTENRFKSEIKQVDYDYHQPKRIIFTFDSCKNINFRN
jgi:predicted acetyltransferase